MDPPMFMGCTTEAPTPNRLAIRQIEAWRGSWGQACQSLYNRATDTLADQQFKII